MAWESQAFQEVSYKIDVLFFYPILIAFQQNFEGRDSLSSRINQQLTTVRQTFSKAFHDVTAASSGFLQRFITNIHRSCLTFQFWKSSSRWTKLSHEFCRLKRMEVMHFWTKKRTEWKKIRVLKTNDCKTILICPKNGIWTHILQHIFCLF